MLLMVKRNCTANSDCGISLPEIEPRLFSFNNPYGACPECTGLGMNMELDKELIIPDGAKTFAEGAIAALSTNMEAYHMKQLGAVLKAYGRVKCLTQKKNIGILSGINQIYRKK